MTKTELYQKAKLLPLLPGIYIIQDSSGAIIYIGKAKRLRTRVSQYFRDGVPHENKVSRMIAAAREFDVIVTGSEFEALVLECSQIKTHRPKYNILLKDDKGYRYIKITNSGWPRISAEKQKLPDKATYIGPYMSGFAVNQAVQAAHDAFLLPRCSRRFPEDFGKHRPCLYAHIGKCMAVCSGKIKQDVYNLTIQNALALIKNGGGKLKKKLETQMEDAAEALDFEKAAILRDQIYAIKKLNENQTIIRGDGKNMDVIAFAAGAGCACAAILRFRAGVLCDKREFLFTDTDSTDLLREEFLPRYYLEDDEEIPKIIAVDKPLPGQALLKRFLTEKKGADVQIYTPQRGSAHQMLETAYVNAVERLARESGKTSKEAKVLDELAGLLALDGAPSVIESYDISNWGDDTSVCGMAVFKNGKPHKAGYRRFKIKTIVGTDDYASMAEALLRRAAKFDNNANGQFGEKPNLILVDGGLGQVRAAAKVLVGTGLANVPLFGMVKDNKHRTRGIVTAGGEEIALSMHRGPFTFITTIQDETHRFALAYQKNAAKNKTFTSNLTSIAGVGPATAKALMAHFKTIAAISQATSQQLATVKGVNKTVANNIYMYYSVKNATKENLK